MHIIYMHLAGAGIASVDSIFRSRIPLGLTKNEALEDRRNSGLQVLCTILHSLIDKLHLPLTSAANNVSDLLPVPCRT